MARTIRWWPLSVIDRSGAAIGRPIALAAALAASCSAAPWAANEAGPGREPACASVRCVPSSNTQQLIMPVMSMHWRT